MSVRLRDGIHIEADRTVVCDGRHASGDVNVMTHAHADHVQRSSERSVICTPETAAVVNARTGIEYDVSEPIPGISLHPAGHVIGSVAVCVDLETFQPAADGPYRRYCYTGDFSLRQNCYLTGFDPNAVEADVLIMETTYGDSRYRFPPQDEIESRIADWIDDNPNTPLILFGYSFGRAQKLQWLAQRASNRRILVSSSIADVNEAVEGVTDLRFSATPYEDTTVLESVSDEIIVLPSNQARAKWVDHVVDRTDALKAGFSGWAVDRSFAYRGGYDATFPLTDHCDFDDLYATVEAIDPEVVYTTHGFDVSFADHLAREGDFDAKALFRHQTRLDAFE